MRTPLVNPLQLLRIGAGFVAISCRKVQRLRNNVFGLVLFPLLLASDHESLAQSTLISSVQDGKKAVQPSLPEESSGTPEPTPISIDPFSLFAKTIGIIALLSIGLYVFLRVYRRATQGRVSGTSAAKMNIIGSSIIGPKKSLCMVNVLDHLLVLGVTDSQITVLLDIPAENLNEGMKNHLQDIRNDSEPNFNKILKSWLKK